MVSAIVATQSAACAALSENEQVSRGMELLKILQQPASASERGQHDETEDVDVKVIVKHGFIEVIDPRCSRAMNRSMSDSALLSSACVSEQPWQKISGDKLKDYQLIDSDASTQISSASSDAEDLSGWGATGVRKDTCWSEDEEAVDMSMQQCWNYQYVEPMWMMPMAVEMEDGTTVFCTQMPDGSWMSPQWEEQTSIECADDADGEQSEWRTTVMLRNMPNNYTRDMLLELVDSMGFTCCYDFAYLPVDFKSQAGLGYAFINFISTLEAQRCFDVFEGFSDWKVPSEKVCTVTWGSPYQGLEAHIERYQNSPVMHHSIPDEWKPVLFESGARIVFPAPTKQIKTPKVRQQPAGN